VIHDPAVDRTTDGHGAVRDLTFAELRRLDAGYRFEAQDGSHSFRGCGVRLPSLEELLSEMPDVLLNVEIKQQDPPIEREVVSVLERAGAVGRVVLAAERHAIMERIRAVSDVPTSASADEAREFFERCFAGTLDGWSPRFQALQIPSRFEGTDLVTADIVRAAHALGLEMHVWTINEPDEMRRLLDLGVDGVMSDFPGVLLDVARDFGRP
jgi:glycerophosphoryl diester phosphodiesterase